jgi:hypothetical protein
MPLFIEIVKGQVESQAVFSMPILLLPLPLLKPNYSDHERYYDICRISGTSP